MQGPPIPAGEKGRVAALHSLRILDTPPEERFDRFTRVARRLFDVPIALVSLVDEKRQWFKSRQGLDVAETPRAVSFCGHTILGEKPMVVPDARADERFRDNPLVEGEPGIRFYAGAPVKAEDGSTLGTVCIIDRAPRRLDGEDLRLLEDLAAMVEQEFTAMRLATTDELTGLSNRRGFQDIARHTLGMCLRMAVPATLLYFDLDRFKEINDTHGHAEGDVALRDFSRLLLETFREVDVVARMGGDEFCVFAAASTESSLGAALDRFRREVARHNEAEGRPWKLEYSVGSVAFDPEAHASIEDLLAAADSRMYEDKGRAGKGGGPG